MLITSLFSIKDLENLTGVKAHTIRIWEKRYNLLKPDRTDTNIRQYDLANLKKLLNVTLLYNAGYKISKIAKLSEEEVNKIIRELSETSTDEYARQAFKTAMFEFNHYLFIKTYKTLLSKKSFQEIFHDVFLPLLYEIGMLWQTGTLDPSHERFISELIKQKLIINIDKARQKNGEQIAPTFALFLPLEEIHELGLLYANYEIINSGYNTVYLGTNIPISSLKHILKHYDDITFLSYFTVKPDQENIYSYIDRFQKEIGALKPMKFWVMGGKVQNIIPSKLPPNVSVITNLKELSLKLKKLKKS